MVIWTRKTRFRPWSFGPEQPDLDLNNPIWTMPGHDVGLNGALASLPFSDISAGRPSQKFPKNTVEIL
jgi:hypothetical protein